jgi:MoxR-like ATPase
MTEGAAAPEQQASELGGRPGAAADVVARVVTNLERSVRAPHETLELCVLSLLAEGHVIIEDFPGVGKTVLAKSLARSLHLTFSRLQFTPDLLPSDVTGVNVFNQKTNEFEFRPGPVFANVLLVDEINRASPKTQSALLEAMQESQVTIDGETYAIEQPFLVVATQNPIEYEGTYPLPEAQLDRFTARLSLGYPPLAEEARMLEEQTTDPPLDDLQAVATRDDVLDAIDAARRVFVEESVNRYVVTLLQHTRSSTQLALGASPRSGIALLRVAKARAVARGRDFVLPEDVQSVAVAVLAHRLIPAPEARTAGTDAADAVRRALEETPVPV